MLFLKLFLFFLNYFYIVLTPTIKFAGVAVWYDTSEPEDSPLKMKKPHILTYLLLLPLVLGFNLQEDDLVFDDIGEESSSTPSIERHIIDRSRTVGHDRRLVKDTKRHHRVERLWDIPDVIVPVGHVFKLRITRQAFGGSVDRYEVSDSRHLTRTGIFLSPFYIPG